MQQPATTSQGAPAHGYGQAAHADDTISLGEIFQTLARHNRLIVLVTVLVTALTILWLGTRTPLYKAKATILLEQDESAGGVLSELASLTSDPAAEAEIAIIRSYSLAAVTASEPESFEAKGTLYDATDPDVDPVADGDTTDMDRLGLATVVEAHDLHPSAGIWRRLTGGGTGHHRLRASMQVLPDQDADAILREGLDVNFVASDRVTIVEHTGFLFPNSLEASEAVEAAYEPAGIIEAFGCRLQLEATGDYVGQRYRVRGHRDQESAVRRLMENTSAAESGRKTNVVVISVEDSSNYRAAETANALAKNYIRRSVQIGRQKAERTLGFIGRQLTEQLAALEKVEAEVAALQSTHPETISLPDSAKAIIDQVTALELERTQRELARTVLEQALVYLDSGDFEALARLGRETPNLLALGYIQELATLETESLRLERTDVLGYKQLLQAEHLRLRALIEGSELEIDRLESGLNAVANDDADAIARFAAGSPGAADGVDLASYFTSLAQLDAEIARMRGTVTPENNALQALDTSRTEMIGTAGEESRPLGHVLQLLDGLRGALELRASTL